MTDTNPNIYPSSPSSCRKSTSSKNLIDDAPDAVNAPAPSNPAMDGLTRQIRGLDEAIITNSGNKFDTWWYALLNIPDSDVAAAKEGRDGLTLAALEEHATSGNFFDRVPFERVLAERWNEKAFPFFREEFLCTRMGFSVLRAEWHNTLLNGELKRGHGIREEWVERKREELGFDVEVWEEARRRDEALRWERRSLALERRVLEGSIGLKGVHGGEGDGWKQQMSTEVVEREKEKPLEKGIDADRVSQHTLNT